MLDSVVGYVSLITYALMVPDNAPQAGDLRRGLCVMLVTKARERRR